MSELAVAVLAEKPSVARDLARVLGARQQGKGYLHGNGYIVTWAIGHLVALAEPHEIRPEWRAWRRETLPILPREWPLVVYEQTRDQFEIVRRILTSPKVGRIVCATDAGREGELIFRYIYEAAGCTKAFQRLWVSSLTPEAIRRGFAGLKDGREYDSLADAARGRSRADWLVGMNLSRAYTLAEGQMLSVGRVQTPTLAMVVERELAIRSFVPEDYMEVAATFSPAPDTSYQGTWFVEKDGSRQTRLAADGEEANRIVERARTGEARIESITAETQRMAPPLLYDLTELQRHANRLFGFSAQQTLELAQALYEKHKLLSYPRTDSRHLSQDVARTLPKIVAAVEAPYRALLAPGTGERPLGRRFVDDAKVSDHHAIIPTGVPPERATLSPEERKIFDLVCRRLLSAWHDDHIWAVTTVITAIANPGVTDRYHSSGTAIQQVGWKALDVAPERKPRKKEEAEEGAPTLPPGLAQGQPQTVIDVEALQKRTRPPKRFTEATLLTAMETAGKTLDDKELSEAMKESGLGTPATRAGIIELLLKREFLERQGKSLAATDKGIHLIEVVHPEVKSPIMTGQWEAYLNRIHRGTAGLPPFLEGIEKYVREVVGKALARKQLRPRPPDTGPSSSRPVDEDGPPRSTSPEGRGGGDRVSGPRAASSGASAPSRACAPDSGLTAILRDRFGFAEFRPNQEPVCRALIEGRDVLLVMPTGSGKSLCYQLPGIARGGVTLVVSPLIALMEDQVAKLRARGLRADRVHSGRDRAASRAACLEYLNGGLDFLFIAPERLRVRGFPEMLAKRKPSLIAIDEAHCISEWGHDFRPDYRMLGQHLPSLRPAPVAALTATATPLVQRDILKQLDLANALPFIHGFRRSNIAIEVLEAPPSARPEKARELLLAPERRPAIVYVPTRALATELAGYLRPHFPAASYHAGLTSELRNQVQAEFQGGELEAIVATIAFGMGIDKANIRTVIHTALPGSLEAYYQEIGRAGRDGAPARAILMHSYADMRTHDYFLERDYPDVSVLDAIYARLSDRALEKEELARVVPAPFDVFETALEKLWIHGGALVDADESVTRGHESWRASYVAQAERKLAHLEQMLRFAESHECRMSALVRYFGDRDGIERCGICDFCAPGECEAQQFRQPTAVEQEALARVVRHLKGAGERPTGRVYMELFEDALVDRHAFEKLAGALARAGLAELTETSFEKDGKTIRYRKVKLSPAGRALEEGAPIAIDLLEEVAGRTRKRQRKRKPAPAQAAPDAGLEAALRAWRKAEAQRQGIPAFRIFADTVLKAIAAAKPASTAELLEIPGMGLKLAEKYGARIFEIVSRP